MTAPFDNFPYERRRSPRVSGAGIGVEYFPAGGKTQPTKTSAKNICIHGICLCMTNITEPKETVIMDILLPGSDIPFRAEGSVVWYNAFENEDYFRVGIEFAKITDEDQKKLSDYIQEKL